MAIEDIKSPLPPRRFSNLYDQEADAEKPEPEERPLLSEPKPETAKPEEKKISSMPAPKKAFDPKQFLILIVIAIFGVAIYFLIFKVIMPMVKNGGVGGGTTLTYWGLWEEPATIQGIIADFESQNPGIKINYVRNQKVNYRTRLKTRLETGGEGEEVDMFRIHDSWIPMFADNLAKVPTETVNTIGLDNDYFEVYKTDLKIKGSYVGIPLMYDGLSLYYNKDLIESGGVTLPKSWWDLEMAANKLTVRDSNGKITVAGAAMGMVDNVDHWSDILGLMLKQGGVNVLSTDPEDEKKLKDVLTYYTLFRTKHEVWDESLPSSTELFANGKLAFYFGPSWRVFNIEDMKIPELKYDITTVPQLPTLADVPPDQINNEANLTNIHWSSYWFEGVSAKSKNQKAAWKFLEFLSSKESLEKMYTAASQIRSFGEIYPRKSMADKMAANNLTRPFTKVANEASGWYLSSRTFDEGLNDDMAKYFADAVNGIVLKNLTAEIVVPDLRNGINQLVTKYSLTQ